MTRTLRAVSVLTVCAAALLAGAASAQLPAPQMMPGFPMLAGPNIMVMWMPIPGATKYNVYMNGQKLTETAATNHMQPAPDKAGEYTFEVEGVDAAGAAGPKVGGKVKIVKLEPPKGLVAMQRAELVGVRWDGVEGAVIYNVYRSDAKGQQGALVGSVQVTKYDDTKDIKEGSTYYYTVTARDMAGAESKPSEPLEFTVAKASEQAAAGAKVEQILIEAVDRTCVAIAGDDLFTLPGDIAYDEKGDILYVVDEGNKKVYQFNGELEFVAAWPPPGAPYRLTVVTAVAVDPSGEPVYITNQNKLLALRQDGTVIWEVVFPEATKELKTPLQAANTLAVADDGTLYAGDSFRKQVALFDSNGRFLRAFAVGAYAGTLGSLRVTGDGKLLATDTLAAKVLEIDPETGALTRSFGQFGVMAGKFGRADVVFALDGEKVLVADSMATLLHVHLRDGKYLGDLGEDLGAGKLEPMPVISSYGVEWVPATRTVYFTEKLEHDLCRATVPKLP